MRARLSGCGSDMVNDHECMEEAPGSCGAEASPCLPSVSHSHTCACQWVTLLVSHKIYCCSCAGIGAALAAMVRPCVGRAPTALQARRLNRMTHAPRAPRVSPKVRAQRFTRSRSTSTQSAYRRRAWCCVRKRFVSVRLPPAVTLPSLRTRVTYCGCVCCVFFVDRDFAIANIDV